MWRFEGILVFEVLFASLEVVPEMADLKTNIPHIRHFLYYCRQLDKLIRVI